VDELERSGSPSDGEDVVTPEKFVEDFVSKLRARGSELAAYGALGPAKTCSQIATELEADFRAWWLTALTIGEAAEESGYSEERLREMTRDGSLPHRKGEGSRGHITLARCDLPQRPKPRLAPSIQAIEERLVSPRRGLRR
jgi:hypothetical protein